MRSNPENFEEDSHKHTQLLAEYACERIKSVLDSIRQLKASEFPYNDSKDTLCKIQTLFEDALQRLSATDSDPDFRRHLCAISLRHLFIYMPILGFILRSTNVRNAFEIFATLRDISRSALGPEVKLILSSEWAYSPMVYHQIRVLPGFVLIGLPASESSNPLLVPLCGHELGHAIWAKHKTDLESVVKNLFYQNVRGYITKNWQRYAELFPSVDKPENLSASIFTETTLWQTLELLTKQSQECFCDFVGLRIYGTAFLHASVYLSAPCLSSPRPIAYPKLVKRVNYLVKAAHKYKFDVPEGYEDIFENRTEPQLASIDKLRLSISDYMLDGVADKLISKVEDMIAETKIPRTSKEESNRIANRFELVVPAPRCKCLADILNAAWQAYGNPDLWKEIPEVVEHKNQILKDLVLKNIEIFEVEQILKSGK